MILKPRPVPFRFLIGLDLGQAQDPTALAVVRQDGSTYTVPHLERFPLGTSYLDVVARVLALLDKTFPKPNRDIKPLHQATIVVDKTGVGAAVVDLLRAALPQQIKLIPVMITAGHRATNERGEFRVPKKELVGVLQVLLQTRRMQVASALPDAAILAKELATFHVKVTAAANEVYGAWREGQHDDLVLALAVAAWYGEAKAGRRRVEKFKFETLGCR